MSPMTVITDYLLYDNRTWAPGINNDWGLKAATGLLQGNEALKKDFLRYCSASASQGGLYGFHSALGGLRARSGPSNGYLLCVTVETPDLHGRPSWAVLGFWLENPESLNRALREVDLVAVARSISDSETKPSEARLDPGRAPSRGWEPGDSFRLSQSGSAPTLDRFIPNQSVHQVKELLLARQAQGLRVPNILGIAAFRRPDPGSFSAFDLVLCKPIDESGESNLSRVLDLQREQLQSALSSASPPRDSQRSGPPSPRHPPGHVEPPRTPPQSRRSHRDGRILLVIAVVGALLVGLLVFAPPQRPTESSGDEEPPPHSLPEETRHTREEEGDSAPPGRESPPPPEVPPNSGPTPLDRVEAIAGRFSRLQPKDLESTRAFQLAQGVPVAEKFQTHRQRVRQSFEQLLSTRTMATGDVGDTLAYFVRGSGRDLPSIDRMNGVRRILSDWLPNAPDCSILQNAFGFEFEEEDSELNEWCSASEELAALARKGL